jgi:hypothetical protein
MRLDANDPLVDDRIERPAHTARELARTAFYVAAAVAMGVVAWAAVAVKDTAYEMRSAAREQRAFLVAQGEAFERSSREIVRAARDTAVETRELVADARQVLPELERAARGAADTVAKGPIVADELAATIAAPRETIEAGTALVDEGREFVAGSRAEAVAALASLATVAHRVEVETAPERVEPLRAEIATALGAGRRSLERVEVVASNAAVVSDHWRAKLAPPPYRPTGNRFVRALKYAGHYSLKVLKATPELVVVGLEVLD